MIKAFLRERRSWILLFLVLQVLIFLVSYLDPSIPLEATFYIFFLSLLIFVPFLVIRYFRETKFYRSLTEWETELDLNSLTDAESPFEKMIVDSLTKQTESLKQSVTQNWVALEQEKDELLAWIHEVKTPLTAMHLMIDRLQDPLKTQIAHEWLRIHLLLDTQLHQKRIPFIENDLFMDELDLKTVIFQEIKTLQSWCIQKGIGFEVDLEAERVLSDAKWLAFIIRQLLTNAVKYSEASDIIIKSYQEDEHTKLIVQDFGRGISDADLPRIFKKGFTSTANHHDNAATGMGLFLVKKIAQPLNIHINVQSKPGVGTTFILTFPRKNTLTL
jgi:two-component system, OmpR family, bacitracin resistance sensor histidine kinase BceS